MQGDLIAVEKGAKQRRRRRRRRHPSRKRQKRRQNDRWAAEEQLLLARMCRSMRAPAGRMYFLRVPSQSSNKPGCCSNFAPRFSTFRGKFSFGIRVISFDHRPPTIDQCRRVGGRERAKDGDTQPRSCTRGDATDETEDEKKRLAFTSSQQNPSLVPPFRCSTSSARVTRQHEYAPLHAPPRTIDIALYAPPMV